VGDASYVFIPDNENYEDSVKLLFDEHNHPVDPQQVDLRDKRYQWRRCYKVVSLSKTRTTLRDSRQPQPGSVLDGGGAGGVGQPARPERIRKPEVPDSVRVGGRFRQGGASRMRNARAVDEGSDGRSRPDRRTQHRAIEDPPPGRHHYPSEEEHGCVRSA